VIQIEARYFAVFRERAGLEHERIETAAKTARELFEEVAERHGFLDRVERCKVAINGAMARWDDELNAADEVLFFPPVAGG
jgi:molybdopterin converting factor subunit 1